MENIFQNPKATKSEALLIPHIFHRHGQFAFLKCDPRPPERSWFMRQLVETSLVFLELAGLFSTSGLDLQSSQANGVGKQCLDKAL